MSIVKSQNTLPREIERNRMAQRRIERDLDDGVKVNYLTVEGLWCQFMGWKDRRNEL